MTIPLSEDDIRALMHSAARVNAAQAELAKAQEQATYSVYVLATSKGMPFDCEPWIENGNLSWRPKPQISP